MHTVPNVNLHLSYILVSLYHLKPIWVNIYLKVLLRNYTSSILLLYNAGQDTQNQQKQKQTLFCTKIDFNDHFISYRKGDNSISITFYNVSTIYQTKNLSSLMLLLLVLYGKSLFVYSWSHSLILFWDFKYRLLSNKLTAYIRYFSLNRGGWKYICQCIEVPAGYGKQNRVLPIFDTGKSLHFQILYIIQHKS